MGGGGGHLNVSLVGGVEEGVEADGGQRVGPEIHPLHRLTQTLALLPLIDVTTRKRDTQ